MNILKFNHQNVVMLSLPDGQVQNDRAMMLQN
jgi:hypothetical protein